LWIRQICQQIEQIYQQQRGLTLQESNMAGWEIPAVFFLSWENIIALDGGLFQLKHDSYD
jgi:hypothetical protein